MSASTSDGINQWADDIQRRLQSISTRSAFKDYVHHQGVAFLEEYLDMVMKAPVDQGLCELAKTPGRKRDVPQRTRAATASAAKAKNTVDLLNTDKENQRPKNNLQMALMQVREEPDDEDEALPPPRRPLAPAPTNARVAFTSPSPKKVKPLPNLPSPPKVSEALPALPHSTSDAITPHTAKPPSQAHVSLIPRSPNSKLIPRSPIASKVGLGVSMASVALAANASASQPPPASTVASTNNVSIADPPAPRMRSSWLTKALADEGGPSSLGGAKKSLGAALVAQSKAEFAQAKKSMNAGMKRKSEADDDEKEKKLLKASSAVFSARPKDDLERTVVTKAAPPAPHVPIPHKHQEDVLIPVRGESSDEDDEEEIDELDDEDATSFDRLREQVGKFKEQRAKSLYGMDIDITGRFNINGTAGSENAKPADGSLGPSSTQLSSVVPPASQASTLVASSIPQASQASTLVASTIPMASQSSSQRANSSSLSVSATQAYNRSHERLSLSELVSSSEVLKKHERDALVGEYERQHSGGGSGFNLLQESKSTTPPHSPPPNSKATPPDPSSSAPVVPTPASPLPQSKAEPAVTTIIADVQETVAPPPVPRKVSDELLKDNIFEVALKGKASSESLATESEASSAPRFDQVFSRTMSGVNYVAKAFGGASVKKEKEKEKEKTKAEMMVKSLNAAAAAKREQEEKEKKKAKTKEVMEQRRLAASQKKADEERLRYLEAEKKKREEGERRKRERDETNTSQIVKAKKPEEEPSKKRKITVEVAEKKVTTTSKTSAVASSSTATSKVTMGPPSYIPKSNTTPKHSAQASSSRMQTQLAAAREKEKEEALLASENIELPDINSEYSDSDDEDRHKDLPDWAQSPNLADALQNQKDFNPEELFGPVGPVQMEQLFKHRHSKFRNRTSSANWNGADGLTELEELEYARRMGFKQ